MNGSAAIRASSSECSIALGSDAQMTPSRLWSVRALGLALMYSTLTVIVAPASRSVAVPGRCLIQELPGR